MSLGMPEIIALLVIALLVFGPSRLPGLGKSMGEAIRGFKKGIDGVEEKDAAEQDARREHLSASERSQASKSKVSDKEDA